MSNFKKKVGGAWKVFASGQASGITVLNPKLLPDGLGVASVEEVLEKHQDDISLLKRNVSWLALHGGGGSGTGGGGGGSDVTEATCTIQVNGMLSGQTVMVDNNGLTIELTGINIKTPKNWNVIVRLGATLIKATIASYINPSFTIPLSSISPYLNNHSGNLFVGASYEDDTNGVYGTASWSGTIVENVVNLTTPDVSFTFDNLSTAQLVYNYSVGIIGSYTLSLSVKKNGVNYVTKDFPVSINSTSVQTKVISVTDLFGIVGDVDLLLIVGVYNIEASLKSNDYANVMGTHVSTVTIVSDLILVSTTKMSTDLNSPVEVSLSGSINSVFTAYLQGVSTYRYTYTIGGEIVKDSTLAYFGVEVNDYIPVAGRSWAVLDSVVPMYLDIMTGDKSARVTFWIKFVAASSTFLELSDSANSHLVTEFLSRNYSNGTNQFNFKHDSYQSGGSTYSISSKMRIMNANNLSAITTLDSGQPYLRISNGSYGIIDGWTYGGKTYSLLNLLATKSFTISLCFKADYHPDDYRTILYSGSVDANSGNIINGISIDVHDIYINNESRVKLTDNTINMVDITCTQTLTKEIIDGVPVETITYIVKIYLDGVLTSVTNERTFPTLGDVIYLGSRVYNVTDTLGALVEKHDYLCDCNIYNLLVYDYVLTDLDIVTNYINNKVSTSYVNGNPNFNIIDLELKTNFCERDENGKLISYMFKNGQYTIDFLLNGLGMLDETSLNNYAKVLGIPIMLIDVSSDDSWTFNNFVTLQTAGNVSLPATSGKVIQYWDPNGTNNKVLTINDSTIELQGTSTLADAVKNLNISVPNLTAFIPRDTWFPEQTYTLKADIVDSSHSNNASIGTFINTILGYQESDGSSYHPFDLTAVDNVYNSDYKKNQLSSVTLKHTVEGFPIFLIMKFNTSTESTVSVTPLGIYSFNLGRDAYRNLGFRKLNSIKDSDGVIPTITTFPYLLENATFSETDSNANWIEIKDTTSLGDLKDFTNKLPSGFDSSKGDFWLNDDSILNARYEVRFPSGKLVSEYRNFKTFVSNIMLLPIEGTYSTDSLGTITAPLVSDSYALYKVDNSNNYSLTGLTLAIATDVNTLPLNLGFNQESVYKYFTIAMLFGLIDNFGKNSTYRSWGDTGSYYVDFYDLDCGLGGGNQGQLDITPDVWLKYLYNNIVSGEKYGYVLETFNEKIAESGTVVSANHNKLWLSMDTSFYRAYSNNTGVNSAYTQYWYDLRTKINNVAKAAGYSNFADYFIDEFYVKQTKNCGPLLFNYDYKLKYLLLFTDDTYSNTKDLTKLHGRKIAYARDWLKKHILFLDSLYYWRDSSLTMTFANNLNSKGSNTVYNTPKAFPMKSNTSLIMYCAVGNTVLTFYFMPKNVETFINSGYNQSNSALNWNFTNSPNIILVGNDDYPLSLMNINIMSYSPNNQSLDYNGYPSITDLNLNNNKKFGAGFNLDAFEQGEISELRSLNFHATAGSSFSLSLNKYTTGGDAYTKYKKLTSIDIGESTCVSNLDIPTTPLTSLIVRDSAITNLSLEGQKYLPNIDLTGCTNILTIKASECNSFTEFIVDSLTNTTKVEILACPNIKTIKITNCPNLRIVNIEQCDSLLTIVVNSCPSLTGTTTSSYVTISECQALKSIDLSNNLNLTTVRISKCNQANVTSLHLDNTNISYISGDSADLTLLDVSAFTSVSDFTIYSNPAVVAIQFANNLNSPISLKSVFLKCPNLERVYGHILLTNGTYVDGVYGTFNGCSKFSIHGTSATSWNEEAIFLNGRIRTPWEICSKVTDNRGGAYANVTLSQAFVSGTKVTNIKFSNTSNLLYKTFLGSAITLFDLYYVLFVLALSGVTANQNLTDSFRGINKMFDWASGNLPDRYMFYKCSMITLLTRTFYNDTTYLYSPNDGADDGLFSPLTKLSSIGTGFGTIVFSKNLFKRTSGSYPLQSFYDLTVALVVDTDAGFSDYSNYTNSTWLASNVSNVGNFDGFFTNIPYISDLHNTLNCLFINYSTLVFPASLQLIGSAFNSTYGTGTIDLEIAFPASSACNTIIGSFVVSGVNSIYGSKALFPIRSTLFSHITNILKIGHDPSKYYANTLTNTSFRGSGLRKYIEDDTFPESIVANCKSLVIFSGFFREVEAKSFATTPSIPGNMFLNNTKLLSVAALMYNCDLLFKLSGEGFKNCPDLNDVSYFCYHDISTTNRSKMIGEIPFRLFYHGHTEATMTIQGTNQESEPDSSFDLGALLSTTITYNSYNKNITNMYRCFYGCIGIEPYTNAAGAEFVEPNPNYTPYKWIYNSTTKTWFLGTDSFINDASWGYTGQPSTKDSQYKYLEEDVTLITENTISGKSETLNYCCAPDLLKYCTDSNSTLVGGLFENCGLNYSVNTDGYMAGNENYYSTGIQGRIPSYLLYPVSNINSVESMFKNCRRLSSCMLDSSIYLIPKDFFRYAPKVTNLTKAFLGLSFIFGTNLLVFNSLTLAIDIRCIFQTGLYGSSTSGGTWTLSNIFMSNNISKLSGVFSYKDLELSTNQLGVTVPEFRTVAISSSVAATGNFTASKLPSSTGIGYVYYGWGSLASDPAIGTSNNNYS